MLDQNTDRMWYVIGAVLVGAAIILIANGTLPQMFASVTDTFESVTEEGISGLAALTDAFPVTIKRTGINSKGTVDILVGVDDDVDVASIEVKKGSNVLSSTPMLHFNGVDEYADITYDFGPTSTYSVGGWFYNVENMSFATSHTAGAGWRLIDTIGVKTDNRAVDSKDNIGSWKPKGIYDYVDTNNQPFDIRKTNKLHHVVVTWDGSTIKRYVDGKLVEEGIAEGEFELKSWVIGARVNLEGDPNGYSYGALDEFFMFKNRVVSASDVSQFYNSGLGSNTSNLVLHYDFTEGSGNIIHDESSTNNHGTIHGASWINKYNVSENGTYTVTITDIEGDEVTRDINVSGL